MPKDDDLLSLSTLAERMGLKDDAATSFINDGMASLGYKSRVDWDEPEPQGGKQTRQPTSIFDRGGDGSAQRKASGQYRD